MINQGVYTPVATMKMGEFALLLKKKYDLVLDCSVAQPSHIPYKKPLKEIVDFFSNKLKNKGLLSYSPYQGDDSLVKRLQKSVNKKYSINSDSDNIIMTIGTMGALNINNQYIKATDQFLVIPTPCYTGHIGIAKSMNIETILMNTVDNNFIIDVDKLDEILMKKCVQDNIKPENLKFTFLLTDPNNPASVKQPAKIIKKLINLFSNKYKSANILADVLYDDFLKSSNSSIVTLSKNTNLLPRLIVTLGSSKFGSTANVRGGAIVTFDKNISNKLKNLNASNYLHAPISSQITMTAFAEKDEEYVEYVRNYYEKNNKLMKKYLGKDLVLKDNIGYIFLLDIGFMQDLLDSYKTIDDIPKDIREYYKEVTNNELTNLEELKSNVNLSTVILAYYTGIVGVPVSPYVQESENIKYSIEDKQNFIHDIQHSKLPMYLRIVPNSVDIKELSQRFLGFKKMVRDKNFNFYLKDILQEGLIQINELNNKNIKSLPTTSELDLDFDIYDIRDIGADILDKGDRNRG